MNNETELDVLRRMEKHQIADAQMKSLGHLVVFDTKTGMSKNIFGVMADPTCLDENGYLIKYPDK